MLLHFLLQLETLDPYFSYRISSSAPIWFTWTIKQYFSLLRLNILNQVNESSTPLLLKPLTCIAPWKQENKPTQLIRTDIPSIQWKPRTHLKYSICSCRLHTDKYQFHFPSSNRAPKCASPKCLQKFPKAQNRDSLCLCRIKVIPRWIGKKRDKRYRRHSC